MHQKEKLVTEDTYVATEYIQLTQIETDPNQPRKDLRIDEEEKKNILLASIKEIGISSPITVTKISKGRYRIIQGHRRFRCAQLLHLTHIRCEIHNFPNEGRAKLVSFNIQNNRKSWAPAERSCEIKQIKIENKFKTNKELAGHLHCSENSIIVSLALQRRREEYQSMLDPYQFPEPYQVAFIRLEPKIRAVKELARDTILRIILEKLRQRTIKGATELRQLGSVFLRAHTHEEELYRFLKNPDSEVKELLYGTARDGFLRDVEKVSDEIKIRLNADDLSPKVKFALASLKEVLSDL